MIPTTDVPAARLSRRVPRGRDRIARYPLWLAATGAAASAAASVSTIWRASGATTVVETWRGYGYLVFAGLFVLLIAAYLTCRGWSRAPAASAAA